MAKYPDITIKVIKGNEENNDRIRVWTHGFLSETRVVDPDLSLEPQVLELAQSFAKNTGLKPPLKMSMQIDGDYSSKKPVVDNDGEEDE